MAVPPQYSRLIYHLLLHMFPLPVLRQTKIENVTPVVHVLLDICKLGRQVQ
jgi:hypothetical protein